MTRADPEASMKAAVAGVGPKANGVVPCRRASSSQTSVVGRVERGLGSDAEGEVEAGGARDRRRRPACGRGRPARRWPTARWARTRTRRPRPRRDTSAWSAARMPDGQRLGQRGHVQGERVGDAVEPVAVGLGDQQVGGSARPRASRCRSGRARRLPGWTTTRSPTRRPVTTSARPTRRRRPSRGRGTSGCRPGRPRHPS